MLRKGGSDAFEVYACRCRSIAFQRRCVAKDVPFKTIAPGFDLKPGIHVVRISLANAHHPCRGARMLTEFVPVNFGDSL